MGASLGDSQSQKAGEGSTLIQAGGNVTIGLSYADVKQIVAEERERIIVEIWTRAQEMLKDAGVQSGPVPLKTLVPLLQYASLEDDEGLQERWAALLANAAIPSAHVSPSLPAILRQLTAAEARLLSRFFEMLEGLSNPAADWETRRDGMLAKYYNYCDLMSGMALNSETTSGHCLDNLIRLGLLERRWDVGAISINEYAGYHPKNSSPIGMTSLGIAFVNACRPPRQY
jgi:hypothetical protein